MVRCPVSLDVRVVNSSVVPDIRAMRGALAGQIPLVISSVMADCGMVDDNRPMVVPVLVSISVPISIPISVSVVVLNRGPVVVFVFVPAFVQTVVVPSLVFRVVSLSRSDAREG